MLKQAGNKSSLGTGGALLLMEFHFLQVLIRTMPHTYI